MSKDKGSKDKKKAPASKSDGKIKAVSAYKSEGKGGVEKPGFGVLTPKPGGKAATSSKP